MRMLLVLAAVFAISAGGTSAASAQNVVLNSGFESGTSPWLFYTNGAGTFSNSAAGAGSTAAARIGITTQGSNVQLYQPGLALEPNTQYTLTFKAYSSTGHDVAVSVLKHVSPYTNYGLSKKVFDLTTGWQTFSVQFTTRNFSGAAGDARLTFALESYDANGDVYYFDDVTLSKGSTSGPTEPTTPAEATVSNPGFESGTRPWLFYTNGAGTFSSSAAGSGSANAARIGITTQGSNVQLFQPDLALEPNTQYTLTFKAYSSTGHDVAVSVLKHVSPYTNYGLSKKVFDLTTAWKTFSVQFTTRNFSGAAGDARLMFAFESYDANGDVYYFDDVSLSKGSTSGPTPPTPPAAPTAPSISSNPANRTVSEGQTASFSVTASGTSPFSYQWQKNGVDIAGATGSSYTTPPVSFSDNGSNFRVAVRNAYGSATSSAATLTVTTAGAPTTGQLLLLDRTFDHTTSYKMSLLGETPWASNENCIFVQALEGGKGTRVCNHEAFKFFQMPSNNPTNWRSPVDYSRGKLYQRVQIISKPTSTPARYAMCMFQDNVWAERHACGDLKAISFTAPGTYYSTQDMTTLYQYSTAIDWTRKPHVFMLHITDAYNRQPDSYDGFMGKWYGSPNWGLYYPMRLRYTAIIVPPGGGAPVWPQ